MKSLLKLFVLTAFISSCQSSLEEENSIILGNLNYEIAISRNVEEIRNSPDIASMHIDSILTGLIDSELISTGVISFDLNSDNINDIGFEIIDLLLFNGDDFPEELDSLAARVINHKTEVLDNSTYGYADALNINQPIGEDGNWSENKSTLVLGTFGNTGKFNGNGWKYLGITLNTNEENKYGWIKVYVSEKNDTIKIGEYAYNNFPNSKILAGQIE